MDASNSNQFLANFIVSYIETLQHHKVGLTNAVASTSDICTGCAALISDKRTGDRFKLMLQYAGQTITWEILFNLNYPAEPPDFIFSAGDEDFQPDVEDIKSLCSWQAEDSSSLFSVITELLHSYKQYHLSLLSSSLLEFEYGQLVNGSTDCLSDDVEVYVTRPNEYTRGPVHFLIRLIVQLNSLPEYIDKQKYDQTVALLQVTYQSTEGGKVTPRLLLSSHLEQILQMCGVRATAVPFPHEGCLSDYVLTVKQHLQSMVENITASYERRKDFIDSVLAEFGGSIIEYDSSDFTSITLLTTWNDFSFLVTMKLSTKFPTEQPLLIMQSIYHVQKSKSMPFQKTYGSYPYSPRWPGAELVQRIRNFITANVQEFQRSSVYEGSFCMA